MDRKSSAEWRADMLQLHCPNCPAERPGTDQSVNRLTDVWSAACVPLAASGCAICSCYFTATSPEGLYEVVVCDIYKWSQRNSRNSVQCVTGLLNLDNRIRVSTAVSHPQPSPNPSGRRRWLLTAAPASADVTHDRASERRNPWQRLAHGKWPRHCNDTGRLTLCAQSLQPCSKFVGSCGSCYDCASIT